MNLTPHVSIVHTHSFIWCVVFTYSCILNSQPRFVVHLILTFSFKLLLITYQGLVSLACTNKCRLGLKTSLFKYVLSSLFVGHLQSNPSFIHAFLLVLHLLRYYLCICREGGAHVVMAIPHPPLPNPTPPHPTPQTHCHPATQPAGPLSRFPSGLGHRSGTTLYLGTSCHKLRFTGSSPTEYK